MSSPMRKTDLSASISSQRPREMAWRKVSSGIALPPRGELDDAIVLEHPLIGVLARRNGRLLRELDGVVDGRLQPVFDGRLLLPGQLELLLEPRDWVLL